MSDAPKHLPQPSSRKRSSKFGWLPAMVAAAALLAFTPSATLAADEDAKPDSREIGFTKDVALAPAERGGAALSYFILIGTTVLAIGVLFKNANRTHLD